MTTRPGRTARLRAAVCVAALLGFGQVPLAAASAETTLPVTYAGPSYSDQLSAPPTRTSTQTKLWFAADAWWALLAEPTGRTARVFELMPDHSWRPTSAVVDSEVAGIGDALHDGDTVHVVTRLVDGSLHYVRLTFDPAARDYRVEPAELVTTRGASAPASIAKDGAGTLWVTYATSTTVVVLDSEDGGLTWGKPYTLAEGDSGQATEAAALVTFDDRVGVLWSDQKTGSFQFASHRTGEAPEAWSRELALPGPVPADNHISLVTLPGEPSDTLLAAVSTSPEGTTPPPDAPVIQVLVRAPDGRWSTVPAGTAADGLQYPVLQVDEATRTLHLFASARGNIVEKRCSLDDIRFAPGLGDLFVLGAGNGLVDPAVTEDPVDARSGLVVLASDPKNHRYRHAELPIIPPTPVVDPNDRTPPDPPNGLHGQAIASDTVVLAWRAATDGDRWAPATNGVPIHDYVLLRNGVEVATVTTTSYQDRPRTGGRALPRESVQYQVQAVDLSGNRSPATSIVVELPPAGTRTTAIVIGVGLLLLAALATGLAVRHRQRVRG
jgi:hypothetical protein